MIHVDTLPSWHDYMFTCSIMIIKERTHNSHVIKSTPSVKCRSQYIVHARKSVNFLFFYGLNNTFLVAVSCNDVCMMSVVNKFNCS